MTDFKGRVLGSEDEEVKFDDYGTPVTYTNNILIVDKEVDFTGPIKVLYIIEKKDAKYD